MTILRVVILISLVAFTAMGQQDSSRPALLPPATCRVTVPPANAFTAPGPHELGDGIFWLGTEKLWTGLRRSGVWWWAPRAAGHEHEVQPLTEKIWWMSRDFNYQEEYPPELKVTGRRLDGDAPALVTLTTTNAFPGPTAAMLVGVYVPTPGCWEITGKYKGQQLSFVVWLEPINQVKPIEHALTGNLENQLENIPDPKIEEIRRIRSAKDWPNPIVVVNSDSFYLIMYVDGQRVQEELNLADLEKRLKTLKLDRWSIGRVVAVQENGLRSPGENEKISDKRDEVKQMLELHRVMVELWPAG